jgi:hypothetical protein
MKIEIDTKNDSKDEIIAAIRLLQSSLGLKSDFISNEAAIIENNPIEKQNFVTGFNEYANNSKNKSDGYVNIFETNESNIPKNNNGVEQNPTPVLADFFSNPTPATILSNDPETINKTEMRERTEFFKEYQDDTEEKKKIRVIPY